MLIGDPRRPFRNECVGTDYMAKHALKNWLLEESSLAGWLVDWVSSILKIQDAPIKGAKVYPWQLESSFVYLFLWKLCSENLAWSPWWLHPVLCFMGSYCRGDWTGGTDFKLLWLGTFWNGKKQGGLTYMSFCFPELFYFSYTWAVLMHHSV